MSSSNLANIDDVESVLRKAQEILKTVSNDKSISSVLKSSSFPFSPTSPNKPDPTSSSNVAPFKNSTDIMLIKKEAARNYSKTDTSDLDIKSSVSTKLLLKSPQHHQLTHQSRTNSNASLNLIDDSLDKHHSAGLYQHSLNLNQSELEQLKEENELLGIKINKLRYDLKARDTTVDDLKLKIAQMYVDIESSQMGRNNRNSTWKR